MIILLGVGRNLYETYQLFSNLSFKDTLNWINRLLLYSLSIVFVIPFVSHCSCIPNWQWQLGIVALFMGWVNLVIFVSKFPLAGIYVIMFTRVFLTFLKVVLLALFLVIGFGLTFYMAFFDPEAMV